VAPLLLQAAVEAAAAHLPARASAQKRAVA